MSTSALPQQSNAQSQIIPRKAIFKTKGSMNSIIEKKELISYSSNSLSQLITVGKDDVIKAIDFHLSGDCIADFKESYFSIKLRTNKYTVFLSSNITSIIKKVQISLPSNNNQILHLPCRPPLPYNPRAPSAERGDQQGAEQNHKDKSTAKRTTNLFVGGF